MPAIFDLDRFKSAQARGVDGFDDALRQLQTGRKRGHWIWYIFPQLSGLGHSPMSVRYGLQGADEAMAYLRDPLLRERLLVLTKTVASQVRARPAPVRLEDLFGSEIDTRKLVSCLTLFREVARRLNRTESVSDQADLASVADAVLRVAAEQGFAECAFTLRQLGHDSSWPGH